MTRNGERGGEGERQSRCGILSACLFISAYKLMVGRT